MPKLGTKSTWFAIDKTSARGDVTLGKGFALFISNEYIDGTDRSVESLDKPGILIDGTTETIKHEIKKQEVHFLGLW